MPSYLVAWAGAKVEGAVVGKVALVMSTRRLVESQRSLRRISLGTAGAGLLALLCGVLFVNFFTRSIAERDTQLAAYAVGLERKVAERTADLDRMNRGMRLVLDHVGQGLTTVSPEATMATGHSAILERWFGKPVAGAKLTDYLAPFDAELSESLALGLEALRDDVLPKELVLDQLPRRLISADRTFSLTYTPIEGEDGALERLLVVITDVTDELARKIAERDGQELAAIFQRVTADRIGAERFFAETAELVRQMVAGPDLAVEKRLIHTIKGNCAMFGIESMAQLCQEIETRMCGGGGAAATESERQHVGTRWAHVSKLALGMLGERRSAIEVEEPDLQWVLEALASRGAHDIAAVVESWMREPVSLRFGRLVERVKYLAKKLGKPALTVHLDGGRVRLDAQRWAPFWSALVHAINNAVDHGIEDPEARRALGKAPAGNLWLAAQSDENEIILSVRDDGRGIDWSRVQARAAEKGLPHATRADLVEAMFADGVSTRDRASEISGRGVGLAALRAETLALGGRIEVESEAGRGTSLLFRFCAAVRAPGTPPNHTEPPPLVISP
jgi:C4-dicarboxylate-specific signal transduction histidine kinase